MDDNLEKNEKENENDSEKKEENLSAEDILAKLDASGADIPDAPMQDWEGLIDDTPQEAEKLFEEDSDEETEDAFDDEDEEDDERDEDLEEDLSEDLHDDTLCVRCGKRKRYTDVDSNYEFCKHCRDEMKKTPMNWKGIVMLLVVVALSAVAIIYWFISAMIAVPVVRGDYYTAEGKLQSAYNCYTAANSNITEINTAVSSEGLTFDVGLKTTKKVILNSYAFGQVQGVTQAVEEYFPTEQLKKSKNADLKKVNDECVAIQNTATAVSEIYNAYAAIEDKTDKVFTEYVAKLEAEKSQKGMNAAIIDYYKYVLCLYMTGKEEQQLTYLQEIEKNYPAYIWLYGVPMSETYMILGNSEKAFEYTDKMLEENKEDIDAYAMRAKVYIRQEQCDKALDVCKKGTSVYNGIINSSDDTLTLALQTQQSIAYALKGNMDSAVKVIDEAYKTATSYQSLTIEQVNIYALFNKLAGNDDPYNEAKELLEGSGYSLSEKVTQCVDKKITLADIFVKGEIEWYSK